MAVYNLRWPLVLSVSNNNLLIYLMVFLKRLVKIVFVEFVVLIEEEHELSNFERIAISF